jgi:hypothetical protein
LNFIAYFPKKFTVYHTPQEYASYLARSEENLADHEGSHVFVRKSSSQYGDSLLQK